MLNDRFKTQVKLSKIKNRNKFTFEQPQQRDHLKTNKIETTVKCLMDMDQEY